MAKTKLTAWFLPIAGIPFLLIGIYMMRSSLLEVEGANLFGLLTGVFHWNNAEVGSQFRVRRVPDQHDRQAQDLLSFFHV